MDLRFKKIKDYTELELEYAVQVAVEHCKQFEVPNNSSKLSFWDICRGVDAYMEKRKRKEELEIERSTKALSHK